MAIETEFRDADGYLAVESRGEWDQRAIEQSMKKVREEAEDRGYSRVLLDTRGVTRPKGDLYYFLVGEQAAAVWGHTLKVAVVWRQENINYLFENTAVNRGAKVAVFPNEQEALEWLLENAAA